MKGFRKRPATSPTYIHTAAIADPATARRSAVRQRPQQPPEQSLAVAASQARVSDTVRSDESAAMAVAVAVRLRRHEATVVVRSI